MPNLFCPTCGAANAYADSRPNFCMGCGYAFNKSAVKAPPRIISQPEPEEYTYDDRGEGLSEDAYEIQDTNLDRTLTLGEALRNPGAIPGGGGAARGRDSLKRMQEQVSASKRNGRLVPIDIGSKQ